MTFIVFLSLLLISAFRLALPALNYSNAKGKFVVSIWFLVLAGAISLAGSTASILVAKKGIRLIEQLKNPTPGDFAALQHSSQQLLSLSGIAAGVIFLVAIIVFVVDISKLEKSTPN